MHRWAAKPPPRSCMLETRSQEPLQKGGEHLGSGLTWGPSDGAPQEKQGQQPQHLQEEREELGLGSWAQRWRGQEPPARVLEGTVPLPCQDSKALCSRTS